MKMQPRLLFGSGLVVLTATTEGQHHRTPFDATALVGRETGAPPFRRTADFDLDGDVDTLGWHVAIDAVGEEFRYQVHLNDGQGRLSELALVALKDSSLAPAVLGELGFLDAGATPDFCLIHGDQRHVFLGLGNGLFQSPAVVGLPGDALALALADVDGDGRDDFVWADSDELRLETALGARTSVLHGLGEVHTLRVLTRNGPGLADVFLLEGEAQVALFLGSPATGILPAASFVHDLPHPMFDTGDIDGDGDIDAVVFGMGTSMEYRVLRRTSAALWVLEPPLVGGPGEFLRDVDKDGDLDGVCCGGGHTPGYGKNDQPSPFEIALNDGLGNFLPAFQLAGEGSPQLAGVADMDGDGDLDLVAGVCIYFAHGSVRPPPVVPGSVVPPVSDPREIADCDGDGDPDVGFSLDSAFLNDGSGHFFASTHGVSHAPRATRFTGPGYPGDFDGDGDLDLLVEMRHALPGATPSGSSTQQRVTDMALLANDGHGALRYARRASPHGATFAIDSLEARASLAVDLDGDGDLDLITRRIGAPASTHVESRLWANDGTGSFQALAPVPHDLRVDLALDLDLDRIVDLVANDASHAQGSVVVLRGVAGSPPTYERVTSSNFARVSGRITAGNLHTHEAVDPGYPDLFFVGFYSGIQAILAINPFEPPETEDWSGTPLLAWNLLSTSHALVGDVNGDGLDDEILGSFGGQVQHSVVRLKTGPAFNHFSSTLQLLPTGWLVDLDVDGDLDLLGSSIVFNRSAP